MHRFRTRPTQKKTYATEFISVDLDKESHVMLAPVYFFINELAVIVKMQKTCWFNIQ